MVRALSYFITDNRHVVQTLRLLVGESVDGAHRMACQDLRDNPHHLAVEVRDGDRLLFCLRRDDLPSGDHGDAAASLGRSD